MKPTTTEFGAYIRKHRAKKNLTIQDLAERVGVSKAYMNYLELGTRKEPSREVVDALARVLEVPVETLHRLSVGLTETPQLSRSHLANDLADRLSRLPLSAQGDVLPMIDALLASKESQSRAPASEAQTG